MYSICLFLLLIQVYITTSSPIDKKVAEISLKDQIAQECSNRKLDFVIVNECPSWDIIKNVGVLNDETETAIKCLLVYTNIVNFCKHSKPEDVPATTTPEIKEVCQKLINSALLPRKIQNWDSQQRCLRLCSNYEGTVDKLCLLAYNFAIPVERYQISNSGDGVTDVKHEEITKKEEVEQRPGQLPVVLPPVAVEQQQPEKAPVAPVAGASSENQPLKPELVQPVKNYEEPKSNVKETQTDVKTASNSQPRLNSPTTIEEKPKKVDTLPEQSKTTIKEKVEVKEELPIEPQSQENALEPEPNAKETKKDNIEEEEAEPPQPKEPLMAEDDDADAEEEVQQDEDKRPPAIAPEDDDKPLPKQDKNQLLDNSISVRDEELNNGDSSFFSYFMIVSVLCVMLYVGYHNRQKIMALILEGKRTRRPYRGRRPNSANYHKLDSNLEEAISSSCSKTSSNVIY